MSVYNSGSEYSSILSYKLNHSRYATSNANRLDSFKKKLEDSFSQPKRRTETWQNFRRDLKPVSRLPSPPKLTQYASLRNFQPISPQRRSSVHTPLRLGGSFEELFNEPSRDRLVRRKKELEEIFPVSLIREANTAIGEGVERLPASYQHELKKFCHNVLSKLR